MPEPAPVPVPEGVRLVGSDLDGTLLNAALAVGPRTRAALPRAVAVGVAFVYVTGRPPRWLRPVTEQTGVAGLAVCGNGSLVVDLARGRLVRASTIAADLALEVVTHLRAEVPGITFAVERLNPGATRAAKGLSELSVFGMEQSYSPLWGRSPDVEVDAVEALITRGRPLKILAIPPEGSGHDSDSLVDLALGPFAERLHVTHSGARHSLIEIMDGSVDKGIGFREVAAELGVDIADTAAVGDMPNDVPLMLAAGTGYAVANAHPMTRAAARHVLPSNEEDGVGHLLEALVVARTALPTERTADVRAHPQRPGHEWTRGAGPHPARPGPAAPTPPGALHRVDRAGPHGAGPAA